MKCPICNKSITNCPKKSEDDCICESKKIKVGSKIQTFKEVLTIVAIYPNDTIVVEDSNKIRVVIPIKWIR